MREERQVGVDVEGEAVHRAPADVADPDGGDLAIVDPDARELVDGGGAGQAEIGERADEHLLEGVDVRRRVGDTGDGRQGEDRVADELARSVVGDVAAAVGLDELGADLGGRHEDVAQVGPHTERVHVRMLEQQQVVGGAVLGAARAGGRAPPRTEPGPPTGRAGGLELSGPVLRLEQLARCG